ncbi:D-TA family PLP-dependent enzyme [soil metagenome]
MDTSWVEIENLAEVPSPSLLLSPDRAGENLRRMVACVGDPARLRPHIKTHKLPQIFALHADLGITKCKCATIAEAEMAAGAGAADILLAAQLTGPNVARFVALQRAFPHTAFSTLADNPDSLRELGAAGSTIAILLDLDVGQHRTGIAVGAGAADLYRAISEHPGLVPAGLHAYDGHLHQQDSSERRTAAERVAAEVLEFRDHLVAAGLPVPRMVVGGTPTFPVYAGFPEFECSPGTCVLWDAGYATNHPDLDFLPAAALLTRVVSRPTAGTICLDLGHKAVASEMPHPRVVFPALPDATDGANGEGYCVLATRRAAALPVGTALLGIPWHICPTVALHDRVHVVRGGRVAEEWPVLGRARKLTI